MSHYFQNDKTLTKDEKHFVDTICGYSFKFTTDNGVFSKGHVDHQTKIMLEVISQHVASLNSILDFGCGFGVVGIVVSKLCNCSVEMLDINPKAIELTKLNLELNSIDATIYESNLFENVNNKFDAIIVNPPIHAGKTICYDIYNSSLEYLNSNGNLFLVLNKKHGALSTIDHLTQIYSNVEILYKKKGVYVLKCIK